MTDAPTPAPQSAAAVPVPPVAVTSAGAASAMGSALLSAPVTVPRGVLWGLAVTGVLAVVAVTLAWNTQQRVRSLEQELVRRQQDSQGQATEAAVLARQAQLTARESEAKLALLEGRVAETVLQRSQLEELIQQLSRSRDENVLADIDAALRVAVQQSALTGGAEPLLAALRQAEERLARFNQPRLERVRRALGRDIDRVKAVSAIDVATLSIKLDEAVRLVDELPLLSQPERPASAASRAAARNAALAASSAGSAHWTHALGNTWGQFTGRAWNEFRSLIRVTRIEHPEAMLVAPEQVFFLRENLKLRLLNARLAILSRQFDTAQADLRDARAAIDRYFDRGSRRVTLAAELVSQVGAQARQIGVPRPDETLAAVAAVQAGR